MCSIHKNDAVNSAFADGHVQTAGLNEVRASWTEAYVNFANLTIVKTGLRAGYKFGF